MAVDLQPPRPLRDPDAARPEDAGDRAGCRGDRRGRARRRADAATEPESKQLLAAYGIPTVATRGRHGPEAAVAAAEAIGYPVVLKLYSETITHKTDVGGVQLNLADADAVRRAYHRDRDRRCASTPAPGISWA